MDYTISGDFIETCDCFVVCPCWVDDDPDEDHCTGLFTWVLGPGSRIGHVDVSGRTVVAVTTHAGNRRGSEAATALYVDDRASYVQFHRLVEAFAGNLDGPLGDLASVSGAVVSRQRARITTELDHSGWSVTVAPTGAGPDVPVVHATGAPRVFGEADPPMTLTHTALHQELGAGDEPVTAQRSGELTVRIGALPGGYVEVTGRSGMRGRFAYHLRSTQAGVAEPDAPADEHETEAEPDTELVG